MHVDQAGWETHMVDWAPVEEAVVTAEQHGLVGVAIIESDGGRWSHNGQRQFRAASTVKIPLMIEVYRRVELGELELETEFPLRIEDKAAGSGVLLHLHEGLRVTLNDLI